MKRTIENFHLPDKYGYASYLNGEYIPLYEGLSEELRDKSFRDAHEVLTSTPILRYTVSYRCTESINDTKPKG
jgi:transposase